MMVMAILFFPRYGVEVVVVDLDARSGHNKGPNKYMRTVRNDGGFTLTSYRFKAFDQK